MAEYIERGALMDALYDNEFQEFCPLDEVSGVINSIPAADVQEVRHGRWKKGWCDNNLIGHEYEECTGCGCSMIDTNQFWDSPNCPLCGAIMDGKGDA